MSKFDNINSMTFTAIGQFFWYTANGHEVVLPLDPDIHETGNPENRITFKVIDAKGTEIDPMIKSTLNTMNHLCSALAHEKDITIEKLPVQDNEEAKYTITIKRNVAE